jgi:hypothetical protein
MTLVATWVRNIGEIRELMVAADSRLSGFAGRWDCCPKIVTLPRTDAFLAFAGSTDLAYPALLQMIAAVAANPASAERRYDITQFADVVQDVLNQMLDLRVVDPVALDDAQLDKKATTFSLGGWSWRHGKFYIWEYRFSKVPKAKERPYRFQRHKVRAASSQNPSTQVSFIGDVAAEARRQFVTLRRSRMLTMNDPVDVEPLEVLRDIIRSDDYSTVGGAPQIAKAYRHMNVETFGVAWRLDPSSLPIATYGGRPLLDHEKAFFTFLDPDRPDGKSMNWSQITL